MVFPGKMCSVHFTSFLYIQRNSELIKLDCKDDKPLEVKRVNFEPVCNVSEMCVEERRELLYFICNTNEIYAFDFKSETLKWKKEYKFPFVRKHERFVSITTDGRNYLFVCDAGNNCIHRLTVEGVHVDIVATSGEAGLGNPYLVKWIKNTASLVVAHYAESGQDRKYKTMREYEITVLKV